MDTKFNKTYKYQLIYPKVGSKIYKTSSFKKGIKKCYEEFKNYIIFDNSCDNFVVLNIDTNELYKFKYEQPKINNIVHQTNIINKIDTTSQNKVINKIEDNVEDEENEKLTGKIDSIKIGDDNIIINEINEKIRKLDQRVINIEKTINIESKK